MNSTRRPYDSSEHEVIDEATPYIPPATQQNRVGTAQEALRPSTASATLHGSISFPCQLPRRFCESFTLDRGWMACFRLGRRLPSGGRFVCALYFRGACRRETTLPQIFGQRLGAKDWVLLMRESRPYRSRRRRCAGSAFSTPAVFTSGRPRPKAMRAQLFLNTRASAPLRLRSLGGRHGLRQTQASLGGGGSFPTPVASHGPGWFAAES